LDYRPGGRHFKYRPPLGPFRPLDRICAGDDRPEIAAGEPVVVASQAGAGAARCAMAEWPGRGAERDAAANPTDPRMATSSWQLAASPSHYSPRTTEEFQIDRRPASELHGHRAAPRSSRLGCHHGFRSDRSIPLVSLTEAAERKKSSWDLKLKGSDQKVLWPSDPMWKEASDKQH